MVFSSTIFLFAFLPVTLAGYYLLPRRGRNTFLLVMSLLFYAYGEPWFVFVMIGSIIANYCFGLLTVKAGADRLKRRIVLILALLVNLGILFYYKYYDFFVANLDRFTGLALPLRGVILPIGISFFTFQGLSYVLDVYMGKSEVQRNPLNVALYIALFPQLIAGPIVRYSDVNREIGERRETLEDFASGVKRFTVGLAKKIILSNSFALLADQTFSAEAAELSGALAWLGAFAYTLQIYFDFSGYSDMAIGLGRMFGFHFRENFDHPYISTNMTVFWRRWHISLSSWFRDYVYIPMGGNRRGNVYLHLITVFFLTGLWHGASWNFVFWGLWHGFFLIVERVMRLHNIKLNIPAPIKWIYAMLVTVIGWVFFRANGMHDALAYLQCMTKLSAGAETLYALQDYGVSFAVGIVCMLPLFDGWRKLREKTPWLQKASGAIETAACAILLVIGIAYTVTSTYNPFIYFNF